MTYARNIDNLLLDRVGGFIHPRNDPAYQDNTAYRGDKVLVSHKNKHIHQEVHIWIEEILIREDGMIEGMPCSFEPTTISSFGQISRTQPVCFSHIKLQTVQTADPEIIITNECNFSSRERACDDIVLEHSPTTFAVIGGDTINRLAKPNDIVEVRHTVKEQEKYVLLQVGPIRVGEGAELVGEITGFSNGSTEYHGLSEGDRLYFSQDKVHNIHRDEE